jgi:hypothetical protein
MQKLKAKDKELLNTLKAELAQPDYTLPMLDLLTRQPEPGREIIKRTNLPENDRGMYRLSDYQQCGHWPAKYSKH